METPRPIGMSITSDPDTTTVDPAVRSEAERETLDGVRIVLVADLDPRAEAPDWQAGDRRRTFDSADVNAWMSELRPTIELSVPNHLGGSPERLSFDFTADRIQAFTPDGIASRVPALAATRAIRDALGQARSGAMGKSELEKRLTEAGMSPQMAADLVVALSPRPDGTSTSGDGDDALDRLLGLVDLGGNGKAAAPKNPADAAIDALVGAVASGGSVEVNAEAAGRAIADLDRRLAEQLDAIFGDPELRRLEAAWRGLKFLLDRASFRAGMRVEVLAASPGQLADAVHHQILMPEYAAGGAGRPLAAIVVDQAFTASPADVAALEDLAATGASLQVPVVASADAHFFGFERPTDLSRLGPLRQHLATEAYIGFRKLREQPDSQFLCLAMPSFLLRDPHQGEGWTESAPLWGSGALLAAAAILASHHQTGWPTHLGDRRVDDLPVRKTRMGALPAAVSFADRVAMDLAAFGFFAFQAPLNKDHVVGGFPSVVQRPKGEDPAEALAQASLPAAVFSALAAHRVMQIQEEMSAEDAEAASAELERRMRSFLGGRDLADDAVTIQHLDEHDDDEQRVFGIRIRPPKTVVARPFGLVLGATIARSAD